MDKLWSRTFNLAISCALLLPLTIPLALAQSAASPKSGSAKATSGKSNSLQQQIVAAEREELETLKTGNVDRFAELIAEDAVFVDASGAADKAKIVKNVRDFRLTDYSMSDIRFVQLSETSGLIAYTITEKGVSHGREFAAQAYISALWTKQEGKWVCRFSQETAVKQPTAPQP